MGLFESDYQRNVLTELERKTRALEEMKASVPKIKVVQLQAVIDFASQAKLLKDAQIALFQKRLQQIEFDRKHETYMRENSGEIVDGFTSPIEMSRKFLSMEEAEAEIKERRESVSADKEQSSPSAEKSKDDSCNRVH